MNKLILIVSTLVLCLTTACETDFDIAGQWKETVIAYGLLDAGQPKQYIRLNKAFLGEDINANAIAQIADSSALIEPVTAVLEEYADENYNNLLGTFPLAKIDAMQEGITKEDGTFYTTPYYLYMTDRVLSGSKWYGLHVTTGKGTEIRAKTPVIGDFLLTRPSAENDLNLSAEKFIIRWKRASAAAFFDGDIVLRYLEFRTDSPNPIEKTTKINIFNNYTLPLDNSEENIAYEMLVEDFLIAVLRDFGDAAINDPNILHRDLENFDVAIHAGSEELAVFNSVMNAQLGITASQNVPTYSNVEGGLGLFASRYSKVVAELEISLPSYEVLSCSDAGVALKFALHPNDVRYPFACD